jgi:hypothetical protein
MPTNDRNILDIITAVNTDLRHTENFRALLHPLDEDTARRVTKHYIELLYRALRPKTGRTITAAAVALKTPETLCRTLVRYLGWPVPAAGGGRPAHQWRLQKTHQTNTLLN